VRGDRPADGLDWFTRAVRRLDPLVAKEPSLAAARPALRKALRGRAEALDVPGRPAEAARDWDRAGDLSPPADRGFPRFRRGGGGVRSGQMAAGMAELAELTKASGWPAEAWYDFARVYAFASSKDATKREEYARRAVELLRQAVRAGFKDG